MRISHSDQQYLQDERKHHRPGLCLPPFGLSTKLCSNISSTPFPRPDLSGMCRPGGRGLEDDSATRSAYFTTKLKLSLADRLGRAFPGGLLSSLAAPQPPPTSSAAPVALQEYQNRAGYENQKNTFPPGFRLQVQTRTRSTPGRRTGTEPARLRMSIPTLALSGSNSD